MKASHAAVDAGRRTLELMWAEVPREVGGFLPGMLTNLAKDPRIGLPAAMRLVRSLDKPAVMFTQTADW